MYPKASCVWTLSPQLVAMIREVVEPFGHVAWLEKEILEGQSDGLQPGSRADLCSLSASWLVLYNKLLLHSSASIPFPPQWIITFQNKSFLSEVGFVMYLVSDEKNNNTETMYINISLYMILWFLKLHSSKDITNNQR